MPGIYEISVLDGWPSKVDSNRPDNSYATKDLFEKHPTIPNAWRYYARLDDTLVLGNGEKANPLTIEGVVRKSPNVSEAIAFGNTKPRVGIFVIPSEKSPFQTDDELVDAIFPDIEKCNAESPAYAKISRDMTFVLPKDTVYRKTDKGTMIRHVFYKDFAEEINKIYDTPDDMGDRVLEGEELLRFLNDSLLEIAPALDSSTLGSTTDVFSMGVDSLQAIRLRRAIVRTLDVGGQKLSQNFVFENPSLQTMANEITRLRLGKESKMKIPVEEKMQRLIETYGNTFKTHVPVPREADGQHILLTGATGSLGAHIAAQLTQSDSVRRIYCLIRAKSLESARRRLTQSLRERMLLYDLTPAAKKKLIALPCDLADTTSLGLGDDMFIQLKRSVTHVIHCAWSVNFNWALESFEKSCIAATRNLLDFCLSVEGPCPASFAFCSSTSTVGRTPGNWVREALPESLSYAQNMGYSQSKLVTENIVIRAAHQTGMTARVLRSGQIAADSTHGIWNASEAIPMMVQTAKTIKALPVLDDILSWTPVDVMAASIIELSLASVAGEVMNVTNPRLSHWSLDLLPLLRKAGLEFEELPRQAWLQRLRESNSDPEVNPPIKLVEFFASKYGHNSVDRTLLYDTKKAQAASPSLTNTPCLNSTLTSRFITYWTSQCWIKAPAASPPREVIFLIGPSKSTAAQALSSRLDIPTIEGDKLQPPLARQKMANNLPLHESERWDWLVHIRGVVMDRILNSAAPVLAVTCSALRAGDRDELRRLEQLLDIPVAVTFLLLLTSDGEETLAEKDAARVHYRKSFMINSQLELLEDPFHERDVILVDSRQKKEDMLGDVVQIVQSILEA